MPTLKEYAASQGIQYQAAWDRWKAGQVPGAFRNEFGRVVIPEEACRISACEKPKYGRWAHKQKE